MADSLPSHCLENKRILIFSVKATKENRKQTFYNRWKTN